MSEESSRDPASLPATEIAARIWQTQTTEHIPMDPALALEVARAIDEWRDALAWSAGLLEFVPADHLAREEWRVVCDPLLACGAEHSTKRRAVFVMPNETHAKIISLGKAIGGTLSDVFILLINMALLMVPQEREDET